MRMVDIEIVYEVVDKLVEKGLAKMDDLVSHQKRCLYTMEGNNYTKERNGEEWANVIWWPPDRSAPPELWAPVAGLEYEEIRHWGWDFVKADSVTEMQLRKFCEFFEIDCPLDRNDWVAVEEGMIW